ncbi:MAG TPA: hypothetical protein VNB06_03495, partial [Thermoanaerobaculia bacterium]|nr:hypothetical protein [Thermoanaerobaculia bacterium]
MCHPEPRRCRRRERRAAVYGDPKTFFAGTHPSAGLKTLLDEALGRACLETGELACRHRRSFARHRTITALEHARALRELRGAPAEPEVELRP